VGDVEMPNQGPVPFGTGEEEHQHTVRNFWQKIVFLRDMVQRLLDRPDDERARVHARHMVDEVSLEYEEWRKGDARAEGLSDLDV
jgi:hypothetical protein